jgi:hypothetical protein
MTVEKSERNAFEVVRELARPGCFADSAQDLQTTLTFAPRRSM